MDLSQVTILVHEVAHELIHVYLDADGEGWEPEVYGANEAFLLPPERAVKNAANYGLFVGSKSIFLFFL